MGTEHGGPVTQKPISETAKSIKNRIPAHIPETYGLKPRFQNVASQENIRRGVIAFRDFLYLFFDRLILDGDTYVQLQKNPKSATDYPFLYQIADLLSDIGYHGQLTKSGDVLRITKLPSFIAAADENGKTRKAKNPVSKLAEYLRFLTLCGFSFTGIDLNAKTLTLSEDQAMEVTYSKAPLLPTGLKAMAIADIELRTKRYVTDDNHDNLLWCDYRLIKAEDVDVGDALKEFVHPLPEGVQNFALALHQRYMDMGMTCAATLSTFDVHFAYAYAKNSKKPLSSRDIYEKRIWELALTTRHGYCLVVRAKKTDRYADVIEAFPSSLQEKIARGYGCDRKLRDEPCQAGCQGIRFPLDRSILNISKDIEAWLDHEVSC